MRTQFKFFGIILFLISLLWDITSCSDQKITPSETAVMTYISDEDQLRYVRALIKSVRELGKEYSECKIFVIIPDNIDLPLGNLNSNENVVLLPLQIDSTYFNYPLAIKAFASAQVERSVGKETRTLIWLDPGVLVLNSLTPLDLMGKFDVCMRPVSLVNNIGLPPGAEPDSYWLPIYKTNRLRYNNLSSVRTIVDEMDIQPYYNCEVYSVNPALGICEEWASQLSVLIEDEGYQESSCITFRHKLFLHQAVFSAIITARVKKVNPLPLYSSYPFNQHEKLNPAIRADSLSELSAVILDYAWDRIPEWMEMIPVNEPLKSWLSDAYQEFLCDVD